MAGDVIVAAAYSHELPKYGVSVGLKNYAAHYCTGLLLARRLLQKFKLDEAYVGQTEVDGEEFNVEPNDDGLDIPHSCRRFPGYDTDGDNFDAETHCKYIFGGNIGEYMTKLKEEGEEDYAKQFSQFIKNGIDAEGLEEMYEKCHEAIRADPAAAAAKPAGKAEKRWSKKKLCLAQRKNRVAQKKASFLHAMADDE